MSRRRTHRRDRGFTLLETMIAGFILFLTLMGISLLSYAAAYNNRQAMVGIEGGRLASKYLQQYSVLGSTNLTSQIAASTNPSLSGAPWVTIFPNTGTLPWTTAATADCTSTSGATSATCTDIGDGRQFNLTIEAQNVSATYGGNGTTTIELRATVSWNTVKWSTGWGKAQVQDEAFVSY